MILLVFETSNFIGNAAGILSELGYSWVRVFWLFGGLMVGLVTCCSYCWICRDSLWVQIAFGFFCFSLNWTSVLSYA